MGQGGSNMKTRNSKLSYFAYAAVFAGVTASCRIRRPGRGRGVQLKPIHDVKYRASAWRADEREHDRNLRDRSQSKRVIIYLTKTPGHPIFSSRAYGFDRETGPCATSPIRSFTMTTRLASISKAFVGPMAVSALSAAKRSAPAQ